MTHRKKGSQAKNVPAVQQKASSKQKQKKKRVVAKKADRSYNDTSAAIREEHKKYLQQMRQTLIPSSNTDDNVRYRIHRKLKKYTKLFVSGAIDDVDPDNMSDEYLEPDVETDKHGEGVSNTSSEASMINLWAAKDSFVT